MDWVAIIAVFLPMIVECFDTDGEEATFGRLRAAGPRVAAQARRALRRQGVRGRELRERTQELMADLKAASDQEIRDLIADAREGD